MKRFTIFLMAFLILISAAFAGCKPSNVSSVSSASSSENKSSALESKLSENPSSGEDTSAPESSSSSKDPSLQSSSSPESSAPTEEKENISSSEASSSEASSEKSEKEEPPHPPVESSEAEKPVSSAAECSHSKTKIIGAVEASCEKEGYTGDKVCSACGKTISKGKTTAKKEHSTHLSNYKAATCTAAGYSGDKVCSVCGKLIAAGSAIPANGHQPVIKNAKEATSSSQGYTGDVYCSVCGEKLSSGTVIPKKNTSYSHDYPKMEQEMFDLVNIERAKVGAPPLVWNEDAYHCARVRAKEISTSFSHTRPGGGQYSDILKADGVKWENVSGRACAGENISCLSMNSTPIKSAMAGYMSSTEGHREAILYEYFTSVAICVYISGGKLYTVQIFIA